MSRAGAEVGLATVGFGDRLIPKLRELRYVTPPDWLIRLSYRLKLDPRRWTERLYLSQLNPGDVAWLWPGVSHETYVRLREAGRLIVNERINCHRATARRILLPEYERLGLPCPPGYNAEAIEGENRKLQLSDYVFAPSPQVVQSLEEAGVSAERILATSYGWDPTRILARPGPRQHSGPPVFLFVGVGCIRKGLHLLLEAWAHKGFTAELHVAGRITEEIEQTRGAHLRRDDVKLLGHVRKIDEVFAGADVFVFPSLEEGGPLVSYEALGAGLPCVVSPMGAGAVIRDGLEGFIVSPHDREAWVHAMERLARDERLRADMSRAATQRADDFTWSRVARRRLEQLRSIVARRTAGLKTASAESTA